MSAPTRNDGPGLTRKEEMTVSGAAMSAAPWKTAGATGAVVAGGDLVLHLAGGHLDVATALSAGTVALFAVAGGGALVRSQGGRAMRWARANPWRFALLPGLAAAVVVFVLSVVVGSSGLFGGAFTAIWHGAVAYGLTGAAGTIAGSRKKRSA
ncbi:MAG TPA: hypothetical protein VMI33_02320 [Streptosporangiaceae bacterium]|nr:hypothetical protein [Streptosporangiaceae bacterium]